MKPWFQKYQVKRIVNFIIPVTKCNLYCHYCFISQESGFAGEIQPLKYSLDHLQKAMDKRRWGGMCHLNICSMGETLLGPYVVELARRMIDNGHFVSIVTNGTITARINEIAKLPKKYRRNLFIKFSFHYLKLKELNLLDKYWDNVRIIRDAGIGFTVELTANDESVPYIEDIKRECLDNIGALCHINESRNNVDEYKRLTNLDLSEHQKAWGSFESPLFAFQQKLWMIKRHEYCHAGNWVVSLNISNGTLQPCFSGGDIIQNVLDNPSEEIHFKEIGCKCPWSHCYAAYVLMTTGVIPTFETPTYASLRDRKYGDGEHFLSKTADRFFSSKLIDAWKKKNRQNKLKIHFGIDDVIWVFENLKHFDYYSIFDQPLLRKIKEWHENYGITCSLYVFYDWHGFCIKNTPKKYKKEFQDNSDWLKVGFHGHDGDSNQEYKDNPASIYNEVIRALIDITGSEKCIDRMPRIHETRDTKDTLEALAMQKCGIKGVLCNYGTDTNYYLNANQNYKVTDAGSFTDKNGLYFIRTDYRVKPENVDELYYKLVDLKVLGQTDCEILIHEWEIGSETIYSIETILERSINEKK